MANISDNTSLLNETINNQNGSMHENYEHLQSILHVATYIIAGIGLPLLLMGIFALFSLVKNGQVAPIYIINLFISDLVQLCSMIILESKPAGELKPVSYAYTCSVLTSIGFMVCISLERYLLIAHPLWYRFRRTIRISVAVCIVVWMITLVLSFIVIPWITRFVRDIIISIFFITPFPLFIFFLVGTVRALSSSLSVPSEEKRRIAAILILLLLIYTVLFLPNIIFFTVKKFDYNLSFLATIFLQLSPLADLLLYVFIKKDTFGKLWTAVCCCKKENNDTSNTETINLEIMENSGYRFGGRGQKVAD